MSGISLTKNIGWTFVGNTVYAACQLGVLMVLAKLTSPEGVGQFALAIAIAGPVFALANLNLRSVLMTDVRGETPFAEYLALRLVSSSLAIVSVAAIAAMASTNPSTAIIICIYGFAKFFESMSDCMYGLLQRREHMKTISQSLILRSLSAVVLMTIILILTESVILGTVAYLVSWSSIFILFDASKARALQRSDTGSGSLRPRFRAASMTALFVFALPLGILTALNLLSINIPRYVVVGELGEAKLGYFVAIAAFITAGSTVVSAMTQSATPRLARYFVESQRQFVKLLGKVIVIALVVGFAGIVAAWAIGPLVLSILYTSAYAAYYDLFVWIMVSAAILYLSSVTGSAITAARSFRSQAALAAVATAAVLVASLFLVTTHGLNGAAMAMCCGFALKLLGEVGILFTRLRN